jgi:hypothetical protein
MEKESDVPNGIDIGEAHLSNAMAQQPDPFSKCGNIGKW